MRKELRLLAGIILHPVKVLHHKFYRKSDEYAIRSRIRANWERKNWERMHMFGTEFPGCSAYTRSDLYHNTLQGAF